jgi:hypothetical protein
MFILLDTHFVYLGLSQSNIMEWTGWLGIRINCLSFFSNSGVCVCSGYGDPHYYTPDGAVIHFMGTCKYTLWKSTIPNDPCEFRVETKNERRYGNNNVAWTRFIDFYMQNTTIRILRGGTTLVSVF